jgi:hypothetical protein
MNNHRNTVRISLRLPPALHQRLRERAKHEHRSLHSQIVWLLQNTVAAWAAGGASRARAKSAAACGGWRQRPWAAVPVSKE